MTPDQQATLEWWARPGRDAFQQAGLAALADLARLRALEEAHEHLTRELALAHAEADAATERVQHLLTTIDVERTARKEAEEEVARLRGALERAALNVWVMRALPQFNNAEALEVLEQDLALHAQDTEVEE